MGYRTRCLTLRFLRERKIFANRLWLDVSNLHYAVQSSHRPTCSASQSQEPLPTPKCDISALWWCATGKSSFPPLLVVKCRRRSSLRNSFFQHRWRWRTIRCRRHWVSVYNLNDMSQSNPFQSETFSWSALATFVTFRVKPDARLTINNNLY